MMKYSFVDYTILEKEKLWASVWNSSEIIPWFLPLKHLKLNMNVHWIDCKTVKRRSEKITEKKKHFA